MLLLNSKAGLSNALADPMARLERRRRLERAESTYAGLGHFALLAFLLGLLSGIPLLSLLGLGFAVYFLARHSRAEAQVHLLMAVDEIAKRPDRPAGPTPEDPAE